uniref:Uncharacterized protein n=1 Tax=Grammatophora oceanica TaxID=210454 RepID=A0A7S1Y228_9STRA
MRLAEDLRFFYSHLCCGGALRLLRQRLLTYRHREGMSQSSQTPRKLLLHLRVLAFERMVLERDWADKCNGKFVVWGAGRDGKDFVKALSTSDARKRVACFVDVDFNKIKGGYYVNKELQLRIPIVHFSLLATDPEKQQELLEQSFSIGDANFGRINKGRNQVSKATDHTNRKKSRIQPKASYARDFDTSILPSLPVVVCVAMYRTSGALERNVAGIGRTEGKDLWHFS